MNGADPIVEIFVGAFVTTVGGFLAVAKVMLNQATKDREADRAERLKLSGAIAKMADSNLEIAKEAALSRKVQEKGFAEAKQRNGHLGEQNENIAKMAVQMMDQLQVTGETAKKESKELLSLVEEVKAKVGKQEITEQTVGHQTIVKQDKSVE